MKLLGHILILTIALTISACAEKEKYPISGEQCGPQDAVQDLSTSDCTVF